MNNNIPVSFGKDDLLFSINLQENKADDCNVLFYDFERGNKYCIKHSLTPYSPKFVELNRKITRHTRYCCVPRFKNY